MTEVLFICDAGPTVGGGHVMRSLTLAQALAERGARSTFLADPFTAALLDRYDRVGCGRVAVADHRPETLLAAAEALRFGIVVVDHFAWGAYSDRGLAGVARVRATVDDQTMQPRDVDVWIDCNLGRSEDQLFCWGDRAGQPTWLMLGPDYAPVRAEFADRRDASLARREAETAPRRVLVSLGLTDVGGMTARVVRVLRPHLKDTQLDVVLARQAQSRPAVKRMMRFDPRLTLHTDVTDMAGLMTSADLCVGAGGSSTWERACLGLPTITVVLASNQAPGTSALAETGATVMLDADDPAFESRLASEYARLSDDAEARQALSRRAAALCDGQGAGRTATALLKRLRLQARG